MKKHRAQAGFTLIEVVFSGLVFAVAFLGMSAAMAQGTHLNDAARRELAIATTTRSMLAEINDTDFDKLVGTWGDRVFDVEGLHGAEEGDRVGKVLVEDVDGVAGLKRVTLVVRFKSGGDMRTIQHVQYVTSALAFGNVDETPSESDPLTDITDGFDLSEPSTGETTTG